MVTATADEPTIVASIYSFGEVNEVRNGAEGGGEKANRTRSTQPLQTRSWREKRAIGKESLVKASEAQINTEVATPGLSLRPRIEVQRGGDRKRMEFRVSRGGLR
jgi:hypothetical protein